MPKLKEILEWLEENIDEEHITKSVDEQKKCLNFEKTSFIPTRISMPNQDFFPLMYGETANSMENMMYNELVTVTNGVKFKDGSLPMIRANYGVGTLASLFGIKSIIKDNNMPWVEHTNSLGVSKIISKGVPDLNSGFGGILNETHNFYKETLSKYPKCSKYIKIYHPDFQGPLDVAHLIWGSDIYIDMYEEPQKVLELLQIVTETYIKLMERTKTEITDDGGDGFIYHWLMLFKGNIVLRDDSSVNLSLDMYKQFSQPFNEQILTAFNGGSLHFCGRADQWVFDLMHTKSLVGLNFGYMPNLPFGEEYLELLDDERKKAFMPICMYELSPKDYKNFNFEKYATGLTLFTAINNNVEMELVKSGMKS